MVIGVQGGGGGGPLAPRRMKGAFSGKYYLDKTTWFLGKLH